MQPKFELFCADLPPLATFRFFGRMRPRPVLESLPPLLHACVDACDAAAGRAHVRLRCYDGQGASSASFRWMGCAYLDGPRWRSGEALAASLRRRWLLGAPAVAKLAITIVPVSGHDGLDFRGAYRT